MKTFFKVKTQVRANMLMEHFKNIGIYSVQLVPGEIYQFLSDKSQVIFAVENEDISYLIEDRAFFCLEFCDEYHWYYKAKNTSKQRVSCQDIDQLLHRTFDDIYIKSNMMLVDEEQVNYIVLNDTNNNLVYYNLSTREYQYSFDKDIVAIYAPHDPNIKARRLIWREKEVSIKELMECYAQKHNLDPKNIIVI